MAAAAQSSSGGPPALHQAVEILCDGSIHPLLIADSVSVVLAMNGPAAQLLGIRAEDALGQKVQHMLRAASPSVAELTDVGKHACFPNGDFETKLTCVTTSVRGYVCLNLSLAEPDEFNRGMEGGLDQEWKQSDPNLTGSMDEHPQPQPAPVQDRDTSLGTSELSIEHEAMLLASTSDSSDVGLHVLFCDDDPFQAKVMSMLCASNGYELTHFANGPDAITALKSSSSMADPFNLVLLDLNMHPMHGLEVLKAIRKFNRSITVIIITATEDDSMVKACILSGANSYIVKPVRDKDVRNIGHFALEAFKAEKRSRRTRVRNAIAAVLTTRFAIIFMPLRALQAEGRLIPHEEARSKGLLVQCDTYDEVAEFIRVHTTAFFSHQWLSRAHPDPDNRQYELMIDASLRLCEMEGVSEDALFLWVDYSSIPQKNEYMQRMSISTLGVYASLCKFFVVVAPQAVHHDSHGMCDSATYRRRGWCRLEQWAHLTAAGTTNMYVIEQPGRLMPISNQDEWVDDSIRVFDGDFMVEDDKKQLVDVVLGQWSLTLVANAAGHMHVAPIVAKVESYKAEVFPVAYFHDLVTMLEQEIAEHYGSLTSEESLYVPLEVVPPSAPSPRRQRMATVVVQPWALTSTTDLHVMAADLVKYRRLFHKVGRTLERGTTALEQVAQSMVALGMPLDREAAQEALQVLNKEARGPPLAFRDFVRVVSKLQKGGGKHAPSSAASRQPALVGARRHTAGSEDQAASPQGGGTGRARSPGRARMQSTTFGPNALEEAMQEMAERANGANAQSALARDRNGALASMSQAAAEPRNS